MSKNIRPLHDRVLVERINVEEKTEGGIIIPDSAKEKAQTGKVLAVGAGKFDSEGKRIPLDIKKNDIVFFGKYSGTEAGDEILILREDEVLGIVE